MSGEGASLSSCPDGVAPASEYEGAAAALRDQATAAAPRLPSLADALRAVACDVDGRRVADERLTYAAERRRGALQAVRDALVELEVANRHHDDAVRAAALQCRVNDAVSGLSRPNTDAAGADEAAASVYRRERPPVTEGDG